MSTSPLVSFSTLGEGTTFQEFPSQRIRVVLAKVWPISVRPTAQQSDSVTHVTAESDVGAAPPLGELTIDHLPATAADNGILRERAVEPLLSELICWLTINRASRRVFAAPARSAPRAGRPFAFGAKPTAD
jgi:hypothetical protein